MKTTPNLNPSPEVPSEKLSEPNTSSKASDEVVTPVVTILNLDTPTLHEHLGIPTPEQQAIYDETQGRIQAHRDKFYGKTSAVVPIDYSKLSTHGKAYREKFDKNVTQANSTTNATRLDSILGRVLKLKQPTRALALPYSEARVVIDAIYENDLANRGRLPYWTNEQELILERVTRYFIGDAGDPDRPNVNWIPLSANLYIYGRVGVGKTFLFDAMKILCEVVPIPEMAFHNISAKAIMLAVHNAKSMSPLNFLKKGNLLIDDLGAEDRSELIYGKDQDPMDYVLDFRYRSYIRTGLKTHFTSNRQPSELEGIYGTRNYDRICEMGESILIPGVSKRPPEEEA